MENELIRRSDVKEKLIECIKKANPPLMFPDWNDAVLAVLTVPAVDAVEVCRCADCVHFEPFRKHDGFCKIVLYYKPDF